MRNTVILAALFAAVLGGGFYFYAGRSNLPAAPLPAASSASSSASSAGSYSPAEVAKHDTAGDCWTTIGGSVYDLTSWVSQHPGGEAPILSICGKDGTNAFMAQHGGDARANAELSSFRIGALAS
jgi:cytochrome b involved in lipid metabolism